MIAASFTAATDPEQDAVNYTFDDGKGDKPDVACPGASLGPGDLCVNKGDTVTWTISTTINGKPGNADYLVKHHEYIFDDGSTGHHQKKRMGEHDGKPTGPWTVIVSKGTYDYCIAAWDGTATHFYIEDPKMIVGGGRAIASWADQIEFGAQKMQKEAKNENKKAAEDAAKEIVKIIQDLEKQKGWQ